MKMITRLNGDRYDGCYLNLRDLQCYMDWLAEESGEPEVRDVLDRFDKAIVCAVVSRSKA